MLGLPNLNCPLVLKSNNLFQVDLDSNGTLSREEFNLFNWRTSGEEVQVSHTP